MTDYRAIVARAEARDDAERVDALIRGAIDAERAAHRRKRDRRLAKRVRRMIRQAVRREDR